MEEEAAHHASPSLQDTTKPKPAILDNFSGYGATKPIRNYILYTHMMISLVNVVLAAMMWTVVSLRGKCEACPKVTQHASCDDGWIWYRGKCYYFSEHLKTWQESQDFCASQNASLAHIDSKEELDFLLRFKGRNNHWIGLSREIEDTESGLIEHWIWTNGTLYTEDIFHIERLQISLTKSEHVFLHDTGPKSEKGRYVKKWICNVRVPVQPS